MTKRSELLSKIRASQAWKKFQDATRFTAFGDIGLETEKLLEQRIPLLSEHMTAALLDALAPELEAVLFYVSEDGGYADISKNGSCFRYRDFGHVVTVKEAK